MGMSAVKYPEYTRALIAKMNENEGLKEKIYSTKKLKDPLENGEPLDAFQVCQAEPIALQYYDLRVIDYCSTFWQYACIEIRSRGSVAKFLRSIGIHNSRILSLMTGKGIKHELRLKFISTLIDLSDNEKAVEVYKAERDKLIVSTDHVKDDIMTLANKYELSFKEISNMLGISINSFISLLNNVSPEDVDLSTRLESLIKEGQTKRDEYFWSIPKEIRDSYKDVSTPILFNEYKRTGNSKLNPYIKLEDNKAMFRLILLEAYGKVKIGFDELGLDKYDWSDRTFRRLSTNKAINDILHEDLPSIYKEFLQARLDMHNNADKINELRAEVLNTDKELYEFISGNSASVYSLHNLMKKRPIGYRKTRDIYHLAKYFRPDDERIEIFNVDTWENFEKLSQRFINK